MQKQEQEQVNGLPPTFVTKAEDFRGNVLICKNKGENSIPLTEEDVETIIGTLGKALIFYKGEMMEVVTTEQGWYI